MEIPKKFVMEWGVEFRCKGDFKEFIVFLREHWELLWRDRQISIIYRDDRKKSPNIKVPFAVAYEYLDQCWRNIVEVLNDYISCERSWMYYQGKSARSITIHVEESDRVYSKIPGSFFFRQKEYGHISELLRRSFIAFKIRHPVTHGGFADLAPGDDGAVMRVPVSYYRDRSENDSPYVEKSEHEKGATYRDYLNEFEQFGVKPKNLWIAPLKKTVWALPIPMSLIDYHEKKDRWKLWEI